MKLIPLTRGKFAKVDDDDFEYLNQWKWYCDRKGYACRAGGIEIKRNTIRMHREIIKTPKGMLTDHIDRDRLNNCKSNLRICLFSGNSANTGLTKNNTTGYKGIAFMGGKVNKWKARIKFNCKLYHIGCFKTKEEAAMAYDKKAKELFGEFACLNFPNGVENGSIRIDN